MTQPLLNRNTNIELYSSALNALWTFYDRIADPSFALSQDIDAWEIILRDPKAYQGVQQRLNDVAGPNWRVFPFNNSKEPGAILKAQIMEEMLRGVPHLADARKRLAQAVFKGQSVELIMGQRKFKSFCGTPAQNWLVPTGLKNIDPRRFMMRPVRIEQPDGTTRIRGELYIAPVPNWGATINSVDSYLGQWVKVKHPEHYVRIIYDDEESRLGFGRGIMDPLWFYCWVKSIVLKEGLQGLERWAQGIVVQKVDSAAPGSTEQTSESIRDSALAELKKMRSKHVYVIDKNDDLQVFTGGGEGHQIVEGFLNYLDNCIMGVTTGAALHSGGSVGDAGTFASDKVGSDTQEGVVAFDRNKVDEDITLDLLGLIDRNNRPQWSMIGQLLGIPDLADAPCPILKTINAKRIDPDKAAERFSKIWGANPDIEVREDEFYEQVDLTPPKTGEKTVKGRSMVAMGSMGEVNPADFPGAEGSGAVDLETAAREIRRISTGGPIAPLPSSSPKAPAAAVQTFRRSNRAGGVLLTDEQFATVMRAATERPAPAPAAAPQPIQVVTKVDAGKELQEVLGDSFRALAGEVLRMREAIQPPTVVVQAAQVHVPAPIVKFEAPAPPAPQVKVDVHVPQQAPTPVHVDVAAPQVTNRVEVTFPKDAIKLDVQLPPRKPVDKDVNFKTDREGAIIGATISEGK